MDIRYRSADLQQLAEDILHAAGMESAPARAVAKGLTAAQLLGHLTHGLTLLPEYVEEVDSGSMAKNGFPAVLSSHGAVANWDGCRLPGIWTTELAIAEAEKRAGLFGVGAISVRNSHHIACLAAFLEGPARRGKLIQVFSSDPSDAHVAPFGGLTPVFTPNPIAVGIPTKGDPILVDVSTSITTAGLCGLRRAQGGKLPGQWLLDKSGGLTDDPNALPEGGSILPIGGLDHGHKGFGLSLMVEALTQGLAGYGRADEPTQWGASVMVLVFDPVHFGGLDAFVRQTDWVSHACRQSVARIEGTAVRLPGQAGLEKKRVGLDQGVVLDARLASKLQDLATRFGLALRPALDTAQTSAPIAP